MKRSIILLFIFFAQFAIGQVGKQEYITAEKSFQSGNYSACLMQLNQVESLLGNTNAVIEQLRVKSYLELNQYDKAYKSLMEFYKYPSSKTLVDEIDKLKSEILLSIAFEPLNRINTEHQDLTGSLQSRIYYINQIIDSINFKLEEQIISKFGKETMYSKIGTNKSVYFKPDGSCFLMESNFSLTDNLKYINTYWDIYSSDIDNLKSNSPLYLKLNAGSPYQSFAKSISAWRLKPNYLYTPFNYDRFANSFIVALTREKDNISKYNGNYYFEDLRSYNSSQPKTKITIHKGQWKKIEGKGIQISIQASKEIFPAQISKLQFRNKARGYYCTRYSNPPFGIESVESGTGIKLGYTKSFDIFNKTETQLVWASLDLHNEQKQIMLKSNQIQSSKMIYGPQTTELSELIDILKNIESGFIHFSPGTLRIYSSNEKLRI